MPNEEISEALGVFCDTVTTLGEGAAPVASASSCGGAEPARFALPAVRLRGAWIGAVPILMAVVIAVLLALGPAIAMAAPAGDPASPEAVIDRFDITLLRVMREGKKLGYDARYETLAAVMKQAFDFSGMTRIAVGPAWYGLTSDQKSEIFDAFRHFSIATYAAEFDSYSGEQFVTEGNAPVPRGILVTAALVPAHDAPTKFGYLLHNVAGTWRVIDIYLNGTISQLAVRRSEFSSVLAQFGPQGLVQRLVQRTNSLEREARSHS